MRLLIVDDEAPARAKLRRLLSAVPDIRLCEAGHAAAALALLKHESVDAALLDIQMPGQNGLELALQLAPTVACAFCTAYDEHALRAFDLNAVDYLLKPYTAERLLATVQRLRERVAARLSGAGALAAAVQLCQPNPSHWWVEQRGSLLKLPLAEVQWVAAADNYIEIHAPPRQFLERHTLADFVSRSPAFVRVHRGHAVNLAHVVSVALLAHGEAEVGVSCGQRLRVSRACRPRLMAVLPLPFTPRH